MTDTVPCILPDDPDIPLPEGFEDYGYKTSERCNHLYCAEADDAYRIWRGSRGMSRDEQQAMEADHELMRDEFHV